MDIVLDKYGKETQVMGLRFPACMWVITMMPDDIPIACLAKNIDNNEIVEWEDTEYKNIKPLDKIHDYKTGDTIQWADGERVFKLVYYEADFSASVAYPTMEVIMCSALRHNGEMVCRWTNPDFRGSITAFTWSFCYWAHLLETHYLPKGIDKVYGIISVGNIASNKYHIDVGAKLLGIVNIDGNDFNKYELGTVDIIEQSRRLNYVWFDNKMTKLKDKQELNVG